MRDEVEGVEVVGDVRKAGLDVYLVGLFGGEGFFFFILSPFDGFVCELPTVL